MTRQVFVELSHMTQSLLACHWLPGRGFDGRPIANVSVFVSAVIVPGSKHRLVKNKSCVTNFSCVFVSTLLV